MRPLTCLIAAGMLAVSASPARAASTTAYGEALDTLYKIDLETRQATELGEAGYVGNTKIVNISGLTTTSDGSLYAVAGGLKLLVRVDTGNGKANVVSSLPLSGGQSDALDLGMSADCQDTLWLASGTSQQLWRVDRTSGALTVVGSTGHPISGLVARDDVLYGTGSKADRTFYRIDKITGAATAIGSFGSSVPNALNSVSMAFDADGKLWAALNYVPPSDGSNAREWSDLATIDPATGAVTILGPITGPESLQFVGMKGFTVGPPQCANGRANTYAAPVGSPWALTLLGLLLAFAGLGGARRVLR